MAGNNPATHVDTLQMFRFGFDGLYGFLNELLPMFKITPRFAQNNYLVRTGKNQAFEGLMSVVSNMTGFGSSQRQSGWSITNNSFMPRVGNCMYPPLVASAIVF